MTMRKESQQVGELSWYPMALKKLDGSVTNAVQLQQLKMK